MGMYDLILKTRDGEELSSGDIQWMVSEYTAGRIPDYQMAAWCMAVYYSGLSPSATAELTMAMVNSGETLTWPPSMGPVIDKHSTGGVGDKTTLVLVPWVAAAGLKVGKLSGRGLGHTGGTLDKLDAIPGFSSILTQSELIAAVNEIGLAIAGQTSMLVPADGKLYALRDVTATVDALPLIASSIMSKKIAGGAHGIVLDIKVGKGAFMPDLALATELAKAMVSIGEHAGRKTVAVITNMDQPLGYSVGNALEVREAIATLGGNGPPDLTELCLALGAEMLLLGQKVSSPAAGRDLLEKTLQTGRPLDKLRQLIDGQGGDPKVVDEPDILPRAAVTQVVTAPEDGYLKSIEARAVGLIAMGLGAGRKQLDDPLDLAAGVEILIKVGDGVRAGDVIARVHGADTRLTSQAVALLLNAVRWSSSPVTSAPLLLGRVTKEALSYQP